MIQSLKKWSWLNGKTSRTGAMFSFPKLFLPLLAIGIVFGVNYYVSPSRDDNNDGLKPLEAFETCSVAVVKSWSQVVTFRFHTLYFLKVNLPD